MRIAPDLLARVTRAQKGVEERLLAERAPAGHWVGELSTSALSTATACLALELLDRAGGDDAAPHRSRVRGGLRWLAENANEDGGWGDTVRSRSNLSTTTLCWAVLAARGPDRDSLGRAVERAEAWIRARVGSLEPTQLAAAVSDSYGEDRTFSVPILTHCALAGRLGDEPAAWRHVRPLPFELAALPRAWFRHIGLPVVSYALPALIAVGQVRHHRLPVRNPILRAVRTACRRKTLRVLEEIHPASGGFLEAVPLTAFVAMSLAGAGLADSAPAVRAAEFLSSSVRPDGSWPIDTDLATWVTTLAVDALGESEASSLTASDRSGVVEWLLAQQYEEVHPYTGAAPGAWAWTNLPGGVPDADDTPGALLALRTLTAGDERAREAARAGVRWLLDLQNRDGGTPTFCRGWGKLPFDRSGADLTAHVIRALVAWRDDLADLRPRIDRALDRAVGYLLATQRDNGSWVPLWFGNEHAPRNENPVYGSSRVLAGLQTLGAREARVQSAVTRGRTWLLSAQRPDGGWGGAPDTPPSIEESALAIHALLGDTGAFDAPVAGAVTRGLEWLLEQLDHGGLDRPAPIGFYFANLWYYERLYPIIFATAALGRASRRCRSRSRSC